MQAPEVQAQAVDKHPVRREEDYWDPADIGPRTDLKLDLTKCLKTLDRI